MTFLVNRLVWMVITLWIVFTVSFFLMRAVPGGPFHSERNVPADGDRRRRGCSEGV